MVGVLKKIINELQNTGERPILETKFEDINPVLQFAYKEAAKRAKGSRVLDFGCGGGYGTEYIARHTNKDVVGFDIDTKTIEKNQIYYRSKKNLSFVSSLEDAGTFDLIVSFQVIEHIQFDVLNKILSDFKTKYLNKGGIFLVSTVNKNITSYKLKKPYFPFHAFELSSQEFKNYMKKHFKNVTLYGQIDDDTMQKVKKGEFDFSRMDYPVKFKILRILSQMELVRFISRHTPLFVKNLLTWSTEEDSSIHYNAVTETKLADNSYIILCECW